MLQRMIGTKGRALLAPLRAGAAMPMRNAAVRVPRRTMTSAPKIGGGPLMERQANRELPGKHYFVLL